MVLLHLTNKVNCTTVVVPLGSTVAYAQPRFTCNPTLKIIPGTRYHASSKTTGMRAAKAGGSPPRRLDCRTRQRLNTHYSLSSKTRTAAVCDISLLMHEIDGIEEEDNPPRVMRTRRIFPRPACKASSACAEVLWFGELVGVRT